jgi:hypothetical protein
MLEFIVNLVGRFLLSRSSLWNKIMAFPGHVVIVIGGSGSSSRNVAGWLLTFYNGKPWE